MAVERFEECDKRRGVEGVGRSSTSMRFSGILRFSVQAVQYFVSKMLV